jgi:hypothetical protein
MEKKLYDARVVKRNIKSGALSQEDYDKYIESLEDCAELAEETETQMVFTSGPDSEEEAAEA